LSSASQGGKINSLQKGSSGRFYQRALPDAQVPFSSKDGRRIFGEALVAGHMESFFYLSEQFNTQDEPTFCGLSTLAMVLNSLRIDPMQTWKGAWRWFDEQNVSCCTGPQEVRERGLTFDMFQCLAGCNGARVSAQRAPSPWEEQCTLEEFEESFRSAVKATCSSSQREFLVVSYCRESLGQTGSGHFSPIGGYHEESDSVLIMDVARFKYPPHWVPLRGVVQAMFSVDPEVGRPRGFLHLQAHPVIDDPRHHMKPLHISFVPKAASRRLSHALTAWLETSGREIPGSLASAWSTRAVCRWLQAVSATEPEILRQIIRVGDNVAFEEVVGRLMRVDMFRELCNAYEELLEFGLASEFPSLRFVGKKLNATTKLFDEQLGLSNCGELWVFLLVLLPKHLQMAIARELHETTSAMDIVKAVRCPWALPVEALRETLSILLQPPGSRQCDH
jgi:glutathione gamma-glutamylcysteinyltransferase